MSYNEKYYTEKKEKIGVKIAKIKNETLADIINRLNKFLQEQQELSTDLQEINKMEEESKKEISKEETKPEEPNEAPKP